MFDHAAALESRIEFYNQPRFVEDRFHPAGFTGKWNFSDHTLIPEVFNGFLQRYFGVMRVRRISLKDINALLNELWEGPGSLEKIFRLEDELRVSGKEIRFTATDIAAIKAKPTEDDDDDFPDLPLNDWAVEEDDE